MQAVFPDTCTVAGGYNPPMSSMATTSQALRHSGDDSFHSWLDEVLD